MERRGRGQELGGEWLMTYNDLALGSRLESCEICSMIH